MLEKWFHSLDLTIFADVNVVYMKVFYPLIALVTLVSCVSTPKQPTVISEKYAPSEDSLYTACHDLAGLGSYRIGESTFKQVRADKDYRKNLTYKELERDNNLYNGYWGNSFRLETDVLQSADGIEKRSWMEKQAKGTVRQIVNQGLKYSIGSIEFSTVSMAFLNDTLVAIHFVPESKYSEQVFDHFVEKYGNGKGQYDFYRLDNEPCEDRNLLTVDEKTSDHRVWENERVILQYDYTRNFSMGPNKKTHYDSSLNYLAYSKKRYPVFVEQLKRLSLEYENKIKVEKDNSLNAL